MTAFTIIGISICVIVGTLFIGFVMTCFITSSEDDFYEEFYVFMFMIAWMVSNAFLILLLTGQLLGK